MTDSTPRRAHLSKRLRFDVLERDRFTCRYCGAKPEDGALHVDHIIAVVEGGKTEFSNLITSCEPCNSGKGQRIVRHEVQPLPDMGVLAAEAERLSDEIARWQAAHKKREDTVSSAAVQVLAEHDVVLSQPTVERAIREYGIAEVDFAVGKAEERCARDYKAQTAYMFAVLRHRREDQEEPAPMPAFIEPAPRIAEKKCPWGWACPKQDHCIVSIDDGRHSACVPLIDAVGGWDEPDSVWRMQQAAIFVDAWRDSTGLTALLRIISAWLDAHRDSCEPVIDQ